MEIKNGYKLFHIYNNKLFSYAASPSKEYYRYEWNHRGSRLSYGPIAVFSNFEAAYEFVKRDSYITENGPIEFLVDYTILPVSYIESNDTYLWLFNRHKTELPFGTVLADAIMIH